MTNRTPPSENEAIYRGYICEGCFDWFEDCEDGQPPPGHRRKCGYCQGLRERPLGYTQFTGYRP